MARVDKPRHRDGYTREETAQVEAACLSVAITLGPLIDELCIVGGLVPTLVIDRQLAADGRGVARHPGTLDLDVGLALGLLDQRRYAEISQRLRREQFRADTNAGGNETLQRWRYDRLGVTVDFLLPPIPGARRGGRVHALESDFGVLIAPGLELAFEERVPTVLDGRALSGERATRTVSVCGPGAFTVLKALAFGDRGEPKDAFDLVYTLRGWRGGPAAIAERLVAHATRHAAVVGEALDVLARDFATIDTLGPSRVAEFERATGALRDEVAADARGDVDDLLDACGARGLGPRRS